jgi:hypothetical protein
MGKSKITVEKVAKGLSIFVPERQLRELKDSLISIGVTSKLLKDCDTEEEFIKRIVMELDANDIMGIVEVQILDEENLG